MPTPARTPTTIPATTPPLNPALLLAGWDDSTGVLVVGDPVILVLDDVDVARVLVDEGVAEALILNERPEMELKPPL